MKIQPLLLLLFALHLPSISHGQSQCIELFKNLNDNDFNTADIGKTVEIMEELTTDRFVSFNDHSGETVYQYLSWARSTQAFQIKKFNATYFKEVPGSVVEHYRKLLQAKFNENQAWLDDIKKDPLAHTTRIDKIITIEDPKLKHLQSEVIGFITHINTIFAEFLATVYYPRVISPEISVEDLITNWPKYEELLSQHLREPEIRNLKAKQIDLIALDGESAVVWVEVKYLGRDRMYSDTSGNHIFEKMKNLKLLATMQTAKTRVILAIAGPGKLTQEAIKKYNGIGVEVLHLSPLWQQ